MVTLWRNCLKMQKNFISELHTYPTWAFHVSFSPMVIPCYLTASTRLITMFSVAISRTFVTNGLLGVWNKTKLVFSMLIVSLFSMHHRLSFWNVKDTWFTSLFKSLSYITSDVSSPKRRVITLSTDLYKSLIYKTKNRGPKTDPCGTPQVILLISDFSPFTYVYWVLFVR